MEQSLLIASGNPGKIGEIKAILSPLDCEIISAEERGIDLHVEETGASYSENAILKAKAYLHAANMMVLADDSGLEVDALNGQPGIFSARFSPKKNATDHDRRIYLLEQLQGKPEPWTAHFHCTAILAIPGERFIETTGRCSGVIIPEERGTHGFGYDPVFYISEHDATMAELPASLKNRISHRGRALMAMIPYITRFLMLSTANDQID